MSNVALFVLGNLFLKDNDGTVVLPEESLYQHEKGGNSFPGIQANEAPIEYLIEDAFSSGNPISDIVYLCPEKCLIPKIPVNITASAIREAFPDSSFISVEEFFLQRIKDYCEDRNYPIPTPSPIPYNPYRPADTLKYLVSIFEPDSTVSIDITGGQRDSVFLLTIASQIVKLNVANTKLGEITYANFDNKTIYRQNNTFDLIDLVNAINAFINYGRADLLTSFFQDNAFVTPETKELCTEMSLFSDSLSLCQTYGIEKRVKRIQECLEQSRKRFEALLNEYTLYADALEQLDQDSVVREHSGQEAIKEIQAMHPDIDFSSLSGSELREKLVKLQKPTMLNRGELLFLSLIRTIQKGFIQDTEDEPGLIIETIRWCTERQMLLQALCIYREKIAECLVAKGFFNGSRSVPEGQEKELIDLCNNCKATSRGVEMYDGHPLFSINKAREKQLRLILSWYQIIRTERNAVAHLNAGNNKLFYFVACELTGKDSDEISTPNALANDIEDALLAITQPETISDDEWRDAFNRGRSSAIREKERGSYGKTKEDWRQYASTGYK